MKIKLHRNGDVTFWNVFRQGWVRLYASLISDENLATMNDDQRDRIARHAKRHPIPCISGLDGWLNRHADRS